MGGMFIIGMRTENMNRKYQKISNVTLVLIILDGLFWLGSLFYMGLLYSLYAFPFILLPVATLLHRNSDRFDKVAVLFEIVAFLALVVVTVYEFTPF